MDVSLGQHIGTDVLSGTDCYIMSFDCLCDGLAGFVFGIVGGVGLGELLWTERDVFGKGSGMFDGLF